jgi:formamidopyrimidine-DNA glycosylase
MEEVKLRLWIHTHNTDYLSILPRYFIVFGGICVPELPEVENVLRSLKPNILGKKIINAQVFSSNLSQAAFSKLFGGISCSEIEERCLGSVINSIQRHGKYLISEFQQKNTRYLVCVHLGMAGAWMVTTDIDSLPKNYKNPKNLHVKLTLEGGLYLVFSDIRRFGKFFILKQEEAYKIDNLKKSGPDVFSSSARELFLSNLKKESRKKTIKVAIMDQKNISGIGNIYACEALYLTSIHPSSYVSNLTDEEILRLFDNTKVIMEHSILMGGTSMSDYVNGEGNEGSFQNNLSVYAKDYCGCGQKIETIKLDRTTYYCPSCQKIKENDYE